jgi:hypothetical protein
MNGDHVAVRATVYNARTYRDVRHTDRADNWALPIRHKQLARSSRTNISSSSGVLAKASKPMPASRLSMLDGDIVPSTRSKSTSGISTRKESSSGPALALPSASHASPPSKLQPSGISLGNPFCSASAPVQHSTAIRNRISRCKMSNLVALGRGRSRHCTWA